MNHSMRASVSSRFLVSHLERLDLGAVLRQAAAGNLEHERHASQLRVLHHASERLEADGALPGTAWRSTCDPRPSRLSVK